MMSEGWMVVIAYFSGVFSVFLLQALLGGH